MQDEDKPVFGITFRLMDPEYPEALPEVIASFGNKCPHRVIENKLTIRDDDYVEFQFIPHQTTTLQELTDMCESIIGASPVVIIPSQGISDVC
jgi:hypothetical protein